MPKIFLISSPSGGGEDSVIEGLEKKLPFNRVITTVTRDIRAGEKNGKPYYFVPIENFKKLIDKKSFIEWAKVYGDYRGCEKKEIKRLLKKDLPILWKVDWQGVVAIKKIYPDAIAIYIAPPSYQALENRLIQRGRENLADIKKREKFTKEWMKKKHIYDHIVKNKDNGLNDAIDAIYKIIADRAK